MEQVKVSEIASEFTLHNSVVISELKKIGVWVPSSDTPVDHDIANRIRKRLQLLVELEQEEQEKEEKPAREKKKTTAPKARATVRKARKSAAAEEKPAQSPLLAVSLQPRKGKKTYRTVAPAEETLPEKIEVTIEQQPIIQKVEATLPPEVAEKMAAEAAVEEKKIVEEREKPAEAAPGVSAEAAEELPPAKAPAAEEKRAAELARPRPAWKPEALPAQAASPAARLKERERPKVLKKTAAPAPAVAAAQIARRLVKPGAPAPAPPKKKEVPAAPVAGAARVPEKREITEIRDVTLSEAVTVKELSEKLQIKSRDILKEFLSLGVLATINQTLDQALVEKICTTFGFIPHFVSFEEAILEEEHVEDRAEDMVTRAPVVTVMGHVDHGKTSFLDAIRQTHVAAGEAGGITQHIGAYHVEVNGRKIVFLDTPGHEAFTLMRARGAQVTDIVILVVAADDGVMPQTLEAIHHARAANVPILVAINKIDKPDAQLQRVRQQLAEQGLQPEEWGGDTVIVEISARERINLDLSLEMVLLVADMLELKANPTRPASGVILEAELDRGRGIVSTLLVQNGTLRVGDSFIAGAAYGKIRALFDDRGNPITEAGPSSAVEILGLQGIPQAGDTFQVIDDTLKARQIGEYRQEKLREKELTKSSRVSLDQLYSKLQEGEVKELFLVLKADVLGSVEVVADTLHKLSTDKVKIRIIHSGVGAISESDILLASASDAIVIGFNVRPERSAQDLAEQENVDVRLYTVIYDISSEIRQAMLGLLEPTFRETFLGKAEVRQTFRVPRVGTVAGCYVQDGVISRNAEARLLRDNAVVHEGKVQSLRRFKDDVQEVKAGFECGISMANFNDVKVGDVIEAFVKEKVEPQLA